MLHIKSSTSYMRINIVCVGKIKEKYLKLGIDEFKKRLSKYCKLEIIELEDEKAPENLSDKEMLMIKEKEGKKILSKIKDNSYVIALAIDGKNLSSEELAETINKLGVRGISNITFVIGGSLGLSDEVLSRADYKLSFSKMTFPHQLMRLILLEQVYRAYRINNGEPYHK
ncbi:23S rRNA (pseudouridine1915-N3)-methyltransferase [Intestinibacter bartlettii DSM 16795]|uniref:Ribosomal RNA large subunit methyltransferase H n=4 Tax=root TaxID=1 RepID=A0A6N3G129_9FIRM|nr:Ribosomal RNA large subunit methyltransferase H [uncultured Clostridium sp.]SKA62971.1 23S rRNA (pseudouridine1915-N3)-methyltransferase [Intestinibacter bartlettii DSM 16795]